MLRSQKEEQRKDRQASMAAAKFFLSCFWLFWLAELPGFALDIQYLFVKQIQGFRTAIKAAFLNFEARKQALDAP
jgi:hypothetical protein